MEGGGGERRCRREGMEEAVEVGSGVCVELSGEEEGWVGGGVRACGGVLWPMSFFCCFCLLVCERRHVACGEFVGEVGDAIGLNRTPSEDAETSA